MAELLGLGCSHGPIILTPPEVWAKGRERIFARVPGYEAPAQLLAELGDDNGLSRDISDQQKIVDSFKVMRDRLHEWEPDVVMVIGDDQAENFLQDNLPPFCLYTGAEVDGYPFQRGAARTNLWDAEPETKFTFQCPKEFSQGLRNFLIRDGFDMASSSALKGWDWGLAHAIINPLVFLDPDGRFPLLPLFVNCYGEEAGPDYPPRPTPKALLPARARGSDGSWTPGTSGSPWWRPPAGRTVSWLTSSSAGRSTSRPTAATWKWCAPARGASWRNSPPRSSRTPETTRS